MAGLSGGGGGGGGYNYVQDSVPSGAEVGETWYTENGTGSYDPGAYTYDGTDWVSLTVTDHGQLSGVGADDHFAHATVAGTGDHADLVGVGPDDHFNHATVAGTGDHADLTGVGPSDHHTRPTGTQNAQISGGYSDNPDASGSGGGNTTTFDPVRFTDGCQYDAVHSGTNNCFTMEYTVYFTDGTTESWSETVCDGNDKYGLSRSWTAKSVEQINIKESGGQSGISGDVYLAEYPLPDHNHSI